MKLKNEAKEAAAKVLEVYGYPKTADAVRSEDETRRGCLPVTLAAIRAALEVLGELEGVEVDEVEWHEPCVGDHHVLRMPDSQRYGIGFNRTRRCTIYMRKQEPAPTTEELGLRLCEAVEGMPSGDEARKCASAFREALDK